MKHLQKALDNFHALLVKQTINNDGNLEIITEYKKGSEFVKIQGNKITFTIQDGVISENGVNGVQASDMIRYSLQLIKSLNDEFPCRENSITITKLEEALASQENRTKDRIQRSVEGRNIA